MTARALAVVGWLLLARPAFAVEVPPLDARVNDRAALLTADARAELERKLAGYEASSGHQFAVLTMPTIDGETIEGFSMRVVERWKLGRKGMDDGLLMLVVKDPHGIRIEVGYGLEGAIPDALAARIIRNVMAPAFRNRDFAGGLERGLDMLMTAASGGTVALADPPRQEASGPTWWLLLILMFALPFGAILLIAGLTYLFRGRRGFTSSGSGGSSFDSGSSSSSSSSSSSGGGFSGGGGDFGGGGASGSW